MSGPRKTRPRRQWPSTQAILLANKQHTRVRSVRRAAEASIKTHVMVKTPSLRRREGGMVLMPRDRFEWMAQKFPGRFLYDQGTSGQ